MRPLEILTFLLVSACFLRPVFPTGWRWSRFLPTTALGMAILQVVVEGYRWQMIPLYALAAGLFAFSLPALFRPTPRPHYPAWRNGLAAGLGLFACMLAAALPILFPVPQGLAPGGPYAIGTTSMMRVDRSRKELYSKDPDDPRRIMLQVWYPAQAGPGYEKAPWMPDSQIVAPVTARWVGLPAFFLDHLRYAQSHALLDAPLLEGEEEFPVLLFSHGYHGFRTQSTFLMQELASYGYIVVSLEHPYASMVTVFPDGTIAAHNPDTLPEGISGEAYRREANRLVWQWAGDLSFALDSLEKLNAQAQGQQLLAGRLDLDRVGALGHSTGGGAAIEFCSMDERCKAVLGLDAWLPPVSQPVIKLGLKQPVFLLYSELWPSEETLLLAHDLRQNSVQGRQAVLLGTDHYDFTDIPLLSPLAAIMGLKGPLDGERTLGIINAYSLAFFDQIFKGQASPMIQGQVKDYPELQWVIDD